MNDSSLKQFNSTRTIKMVCNQDNSLNEKNNKYLHLDRTGIKDNETLVYDRFISDIKFKNSCYSVSLLFKENRPKLPGNYQISLNSLKKLYTCHVKR